MDFFKFMADWGIWEMMNLLIALIPSALIIAYLFPRKAIDNLYIDTKLGSINSTYTKVILVELRNHTNEPIYLLSLGFSFGKKVLPSPNGAKDAATGVYEIKFEGRVPNTLTEIDTLIRPNQTINTWIPIDPNQNDAAVLSALQKTEVGVLRFKCQKISSRPHRFTKLKIPV